MHHSPEEPCACSALRKASRAVTRLYDEALEEAGLTLTQFSVLRTLRREGKTQLMRLADLLVMERTTLYRALDPLERQGWVRLTDTGGRAKAAALTAAGMQKLQTATGIWQDMQDYLLGALGPDWPVLQTTLARLVEHTRKGEA